MWMGCVLDGEFEKQQYAATWEGSSRGVETGIKKFHGV